MFNLPWCRAIPSVAIAVFVVTCCSWGTLVAEEQVIKLGGIRNVTATIVKSDETYRITVEMLPVKAFDPATNKQLNLTKAQVYAARALAKHLGADKSSRLVIRGLEVRETGISGKFFRLVAEIPRNGITVATAGTSPAKDEAAEPARPPSPSAQPAEQPTQAASSRNVFRVSAGVTTLDFLNRKADYLETIAELREVLTDDGKALERSASSPDDFYEAVGNLEERSNAAFQSLRASIDGDNLLVSIEQEELHLALKKAHAATLESLKTAVSRFDRRHDKVQKRKEKTK